MVKINIYKNGLVNIQITDDKFNIKYFTFHPAIPYMGRWTVI